MTVHYLNNKRFEELIKLYLIDKKAYEVELFENFSLLITNIQKTFHFKVEEEDASQECFVLILKTLPNFKPENGSAFNYFTTIILNNLKLIYTKKKKYKEKIEIYSLLKKLKDQ